MATIAIVGVTGIVGQELLKVLTERDFPADKVIVCASERSVGKKVRFRNRDFRIVSLKECLDARPDITFFAAGSGVAHLWGRRFAKAGSYVIDKSSAFRDDASIPLVIPEVNGQEVQEGRKIIASPNCTTTQLLVAIAPLHRRYRAVRLVVSTYQSVTGTGMKAVRQLENERQGTPSEMAYPFAIDGNVIPCCDAITPNGYTKEEMKLVNETKKILNDSDIRITATAVRVPVMGGHSEAVNVEFEKDFDLDEVRRLLGEAPGIAVFDDPAKDKYPMPLTAKGRDEVFVGRLRRDESQPRTLNMWVVADNLRKGAATNAVQIAELLLKRGFVERRMNSVGELSHRGGA